MTKKLNSLCKQVVIIDNGSSQLENLISIIADYQPKIVKLNQIDQSEIPSNSVVILSGGHNEPILWHHKTYEQELNLIKDHKGPIIGICLGFEMIVHIFGSHMHMSESRVSGQTVIHPTKNSEDFLDQKCYTVYESHNWATKMVKKPLLPLATSDFGVELLHLISSDLC